MQSVSSRIWTRVAVSISYDDNHYTGTSYLIHRWGHNNYDWTSELLSFFYTHQSFITEASSSDAVLYHIQKTPHYLKKNLLLSAMNKLREVKKTKTLF